MDFIRINQSEFQERFDEIFEKINICSDCYLIDDKAVLIPQHVYVDLYHRLNSECLWPGDWPAPSSEVTIYFPECKDETLATK